MSLDLTDDKSTTLVEDLRRSNVFALSRWQAITWTNGYTSHHQVRLSELTHWGRDNEAETNGRHFPDDIFKCIFLDENVSISIKISLKFVPKGQINNIPALD